MFNFTPIIQKLSTFRNNSKDGINEEQTKHSLVLPFLKELGYDTEDIYIVEPEYKITDINSSNGYIDYALKYRNTPLIFIEVKRLGEVNDKCVDQLKTYIDNHKTAVYGILTDGNEYRFYNVRLGWNTKDKIKTRSMRKNPIYQFNLESLSKLDFEFLMLFQYSNLQNLRQRNYRKPLLISIFENLDALLDKDYIKKQLKKFDSIDDTTRQERILIISSLKQELAQMLYTYKYIPFNQCEGEIALIKDYKIQAPTTSDLTLKFLNYLVQEHSQCIEEFIIEKIPSRYIFFEHILTFDNKYKHLISNSIGMDANYIQLNNDAYFYPDIPSPLLKTLCVLAAISCGYRKKDILFTH